MKRLLLKRSIIASTNIALSLRTRQRSSLWEISKRWCKPLSMPQCSRFRRNQLGASSREGSRLVISATSSSLRPSVWRSSRAACSANGKQTCSPVTGAVQILRLSLRPLLISSTRALVGVDSRGGKIALRSGDECFDVCAHGGLVPLDREQIIGAVFQDQSAGGFILGVQGVQRDEPAFELQVLKQLSRHGNFVSLLVHQCTAQVVLARYGDRAQNRGAAAVPGFLAIQYDQLILGCRAAPLLLDGQNGLLHLRGVDALEHPAKGRLCRSGILALAITPDTKGAALGLAQAPGKLGDVLLPARSTAEGG